MRNFIFITTAMSICMLPLLLVPATAQAATATAIIEGTTEGSEIVGWAQMEDTEEGLAINAHLFGAEPGRHGFHIHETGSCEEGGMAAGGHFNPSALPHGDIVKDGVDKVHAGDLGNIEINENGDGSLSLVVKGLSMSGDGHTVVGRAVIVHEKPDDFGQPAGNTGGRIACGIITEDIPPAE